MFAMISRRLAVSLLSLVFLVTIVFFMIHATPGGPAYSILGMHASPQAVAALNRQMGLNQPLSVQYAIWWAHLFEGRLGYSYIQHIAVSRLLGTYTRRTLLLDLCALALAVLSALLVGMVQGYYADRALGKIIGFAQILFYALPVFFIGILLIYIFSIRLNWLPPGGIGHHGGMSQMRHLILPAVTLALPIGAGLSRYFGHQARQEYRLDYVRTARARGFSDLYVAYRHVLRNAVRPFITMVGMMIPALFVGGVLTESVFNYPGLGWLLWRSALDQDYPTLSAITLLIGILTIAGNLAADVLNSILDVRVRYE
ncbi:MAG: ABC transporter permease [Gammaproteobacteria bacterium]